jgi:proteasome accessory factor B
MGQIKTFGLDRISALEITTTIFIYPENYNPEVAFSESFGIINDSYAQRVVLSFNFEQGRFAKSYPLHHSQKELLVTDDEYRVGLFIQPTYDFVMELLSLGSDVKVLEPQSLIHEMKMKLQQALALY